ncbi:MAG TPA: MFS transporter [Thermoanaerobaculia bacterium]|nr:MFS transporter [Thermoanaerobaculia bacterium]
MTERPPSSARRREILAWAVYDVGNSAFTTLIVTFIYSAYFTQAIADDPDRGAIFWSRAVNLSALAVVILSPIAGAMADLSGRKKRFLMGATLLCIVPTALLFFPHRGDVMAALILFAIANVGFEAGYVFYNAFLPEVSTRDTIGRVSGLGQGLGYFGGLACLVLALGMVRGWVPSAGDLHVRSTNLLVAAWFALFAVPLFLIVRERPPAAAAGPAPPLSEIVRIAFRRVVGTVRHLKGYREAAKLIVARMIYNDGLVTIFSFASIFAAATFGLTTEQLIVFGIAINVVSGVGSFLLGPVTDRIGGKRTILITLVVLIAATILGATARSLPVFWVSALLLGAMVGPNQAASRSLLALLTPEEKHAEFFGFFAFSGKLASVLGPLLYGIVLEITRSQRAAMASILVFFVAGMAVLITVRDPVRPRRREG